MGYFGMQLFNICEKQSAEFSEVFWNVRSKSVNQANYNPSLDMPIQEYVFFLNYMQNHRIVTFLLFVFLLYIEVV